MESKQKRTKKRLHLVPLLVGGYAVLLGLGLAAAGLLSGAEGIGMVRVILGLGMAGVGLYGIWDGVRDLIMPGKKTAGPILTPEEKPEPAAEIPEEISEEIPGEMSENPRAQWHQLLVIFGENWHDEHKFFSGRDLELAVEGVQGGKYQKIIWEWGCDLFVVLPGQQEELRVLWRTVDLEKRRYCFYAREGTAVQVKFWLIRYLDHGFFEEMGGWNDITAEIEKQWRKEKKHGKIL